MCCGWLCHQWSLCDIYCLWSDEPVSFCFADIMMCHPYGHNCECGDATIIRTAARVNSAKATDDIWGTVHEYQAINAPWNMLSIFCGMVNIWILFCCKYQNKHAEAISSVRQQSWTGEREETVLCSTAEGLASTRQAAVPFASFEQIIDGNVK